MECYWIRNTDRSLARLRKASRGVAVLPLASIESHGPHLPLGSDPICFRNVLDRVVRQETVAVLPVLEYSYVAHARLLPGAIHIRSDLLADLAENICDEVNRNGFDKVVLLHGHGGNVTLDGGFMARMLERDKPYTVYSVPVLPGFWADIQAQAKTRDLGHACEFETSMNMAACPELVDLKALGKRTFPSQPAPDIGQASTPMDWTVRHPDMAVGTPQAADAARGEQWLQMWADALVRHVRLIKRDKVLPAVRASYIRRSNALRPGRRRAGARSQ